MAQLQGKNENLCGDLARELAHLPEKIERIFTGIDAIKTAAEKYAGYDDFLFIARKYNYATAFEGALKLKETSYIHAEACGAGEMKHGHLAMIDETFPTFAIATQDSVYEKMLSNIQEIRARKGLVIALATEGNKGVARVANDTLYVPETLEMLSPILNVVPLHLFAYYLATSRGHNVDRPRNLAKSVTVE
jgi:glucosamine--fructose-6-phosphate aminotransferase (isomerizing)